MSTPQTPNPSAAGVLLAIAILGGAVIGMIARQPSAGVVGGVAVGVVAALLFWWRDRKRTGV
ncbi:hypothetical protein Q4F19_18375 [Sphingomonas sp. BIUV-7]|uniref:PEP-CTERM protein-sorting domain-containing protein n=1 Tax=Sphingomonas natans TaxID=3063330 RepID=A0ABT8YDD5_9SPHN|nr:hypothetical protein [Sphingomonas sp. BIUV-7]MDO6416358.1 hypothetical protein [Sphingomonas sp. BIUV-7]